MCYPSQDTVYDLDDVLDDILMYSNYAMLFMECPDVESNPIGRDVKPSDLSASKTCLIWKQFVNLWIKLTTVASLESTRVF